jgi:NAD-dependent deacetylase
MTELSEFKHLPELAELVKVSKSVTILTGAGISVESGIPTFREALTGLWSQYNPEELATPSAFRNNPELVWDWYLWRRELIDQSEPNPGHKTLADLERLFSQQSRGFTLITQNVDGFHRRAGSQNIIELHGNLMRNKCSECNALVPNNRYSFEKEIPHCHFCDGLIRPDVVWFGENLPPDAIDSAWNAATNCDLFLSIGTSALVQPAASLPLLAIENGAVLVEINPNTTHQTQLATYSIKGPAGIVLPGLMERIQPKTQDGFSQT